MKQIYLWLSIFASFVLCSCSHTISLGNIGHDYARYNIDKRIENEEYKVIRNVSGEARALYFLGIGGLDHDTKKLNAKSYADMVKNANLKYNQAIINVMAEMRVAIFPFIGVRAVHTTGTIIEFNNSTLIYPTESVTSKSAYTGFQFRVGDYYSNGDKKGVIISVSADGRHGKIVSLSHAYKTYSNALEWCYTQGNGWRLPTISEINTILSNIGIVNAIMATKSLVLSPDVPYWTSVEFSANQACVATNKGSINENKDKVCCVVAISDF